MSADTLSDRIADAIATAEIGFSVELTRLVDGESTYALTYSNGEKHEFGSTDECYDHVRQRKRDRQAEEVLGVLERINARIEATQADDADVLIDAMLKAHDECRDLSDMLLGVRDQYRARREATREAVRSRMLGVSIPVTLIQPPAPQPDAHPYREQGRDMGGDK